ncbi:transmembrane protein 45A isoform X2 [Salminus brasiliensis]|uniref:transmembrane protein 45A isoform X2 n=1 Tax=Salminus brasiliensis TaxID=930266 RepID=UPI003B837933
MGNFKGHALPGSFFLIAGLWWAVKYSLWYATRRNKSAGAGRITTRAMQHRLEITEGAVTLCFSLIGILGEQFAAGGPKFHLYDSSTQHWYQLMNWQHTTMYLFFALAGATSLTVHSIDGAPLALDRLLLGLAFFNEVFGGAVICLLEVFHRGNILLELLRAALCLLQGSWFWQIAFVLYPPSEVKWDLSDHNNMMFITMCYSWHLAFALLTVAAAHTTVLCVVRSKLRRMPPMEMGLLKPREREADSEDEVL